MLALVGSLNPHDKSTITNTAERHLTAAPIQIKDHSRSLCGTAASGSRSASRSRFRANFTRSPTVEEKAEAKEPLRIFVRFKQLLSSFDDGGGANSSARSEAHRGAIADLSRAGSRAVEAATK